MSILNFDYEVSMMNIFCKIALFFPSVLIYFGILFLYAISLDFQK